MSVYEADITSSNNQTTQIPTILSRHDSAPLAMVTDDTNFT